MSSRFSSPELLNLGPPPDLASRPYETLLIETKAKIVVDMAAIGITYDVANLETDPIIVVAQSDVYRDLLRRRAIDDAIAQTYLGSAAGPYLDVRAADYGVLRRSLPHTLTEPAPVARPTTVPPAWTWDAVAALWKEDDTSLRTRARLSWEALSVAGPAGAYAFHAADAHPAVDGEGTVVIGPETDLVEPGEVLLVIQSNLGNGVPSRAVLDTVAARLDAYRVTDGFGASTIRTVRDNQSVPVDLTGAKLRMRLAQVVGETVDIDNAALVLSTDNGAITVPSPSQGGISLYLPADQARGLLAGAYVYDLVATWASPARVDRLLHGVVTVEQGIS